MNPRIGIGYALLAILLITAVGLPAAAQEPAPAAAGPDRSSPRETFRSFLQAMIDAKEGDSRRIEDAAACFDLSGVTAGSRPTAGKQLASDLKNYLDRVELIDLERIPEQVDGSRWVYLRDRHGEVSLARDDAGLWLFSRETIAAMPDLLASVRGKEIVEGIQGGGGAPSSVAGLIRERMSPQLLKRIFLLENWQWLALMALALLGVIVDWTVRFIVGTWLKRLLAASDRLREDKFQSDFLRPIGILAMGLLWMALLRVLDLPVRAFDALNFAVQLVVACGAVWGAYRLVDLVAAHFLALAQETETKVDDILVPMLRRAIKIVVISFGILFIAGNLDIDITSLLAGLGIGGLAFALAAKDTVENLFGSVTVLIDRPFQIGDWVKIGSTEGTVEEIGFRSTRIRTFYNSRITVPNSTLVNAAVDNLGERRYRRISCKIGVQYDTPPAKIDAFCEGIREIVRRHPYTRKDYYNVYFNEFADSSLNILLYVFHECPDWTTELRERHRLFVDIVKLAQALGVEFAFPTQTLHLASVPNGMAGADPAAVAVPPADGQTDEAIRLGRAEADAILAALGAEPQAPVKFNDPDSLRTGK